MFARVCDACQKQIPQRQYLELSVRVLNPAENEEQDPTEELHGDYCDGCVAAGAAIEDLVGGLQKYDGLEPERRKAGS